MTHDHVEDLAIIEAALRTDRPRLDRAHRLALEVGAVPRAAAVEPGTTRRTSHGSTTPIGIAGIRSKEPAAIAVSVAARVLQLVEEARRSRPPTDPADIRS